METKVKLGGRDWDLVYTLWDREAIEEAFPRPSGTPGILLDLIQDHCSSARGSFRVQATVLWAGMRHQRKNLTVEKVKEWIAEYLKSGAGSVVDLLGPALRALGRDAAAGVAVKVEEEPDPAPDPEGKAPAPPPET